MAWKTGTWDLPCGGHRRNLPDGRILIRLAKADWKLAYTTGSERHLADMAMKLEPHGGFESQPPTLLLGQNIYGAWAELAVNRCYAAEYNPRHNWFDEPDAEALAFFNCEGSEVRKHIDVKWSGSSPPKLYIRTNKAIRLDWVYILTSGHLPGWLTLEGWLWAVQAVRWHDEQRNDVAICTEGSTKSYRVPKKHLNPMSMLKVLPTTSSVDAEALK